MPSQVEIQAAITAVLRKSAVDPAFRALALDDTAAAIKDASGLDLPPDVKIDFIEATSEEAPADGYLTIELPPLSLPS